MAPEQYNSKDFSKFKPWWTKVKAYIKTYPNNFDFSKKRISWVDSLFKDNALVYINIELNLSEIQFYQIIYGKIIRIL